MAHHCRAPFFTAGRVTTIAGGVSADLLLLVGGHTYGHGQLFSLWAAASLALKRYGLRCAIILCPPPCSRVRPTSYRRPRPRSRKPISHAASVRPSLTAVGAALPPLELGLGLGGQPLS
ncbi:hypothetical protein ZWY2020_015021 [Hordeum vulgare]|nr:hypothetical protein ZWY2020_015021 [Hordeum vulgare]